MYHPTTRVLTILELLQARASLSGADLAARLEVDRRTVRRYITMLQDLGIPIEAMRGPLGGYRIRPGFKLPPLMLADDEANGELIMTISAAAQQQQRMLLRYQSGEQETVRSFDPYGLVYHWDRWYTVGWCHLREDVRVFRLDRVVDVTPVAATFTRTPDFDSLSYVLDSLAAAPWSWSVEVVLETTLEEARQRIPPGNAILTPVAGGVLVQLGVDRLDWMARRLMLVGCPFVIRHPPELRDALRQLAAEAAAMAERVEL
jgi:predicted DNA-binding transcriptional regulator YafY